MSPRDTHLVAHDADQEPPADEPFAQNVAELCLEIARLRTLNQRTLGERETAARIANEANAQLDQARAAIRTLRHDLGLARRLATASATEGACAQREAVELDESNRAARSNLAELVMRLQRLAGSRVAADVMYAASANPAVAAVADPIDRAEMLTAEAAVRKALNDARADVARLERRNAELAHKAEVSAPRQPRVADDAQLRADLAALARRERLAQSQAMSMRLALTAAHAELHAHRQHAARAGASRGTPPAAAHAASIGGWELVECVPGLEPSASGANAAARMPEAMLARVRGVTYRMSRVRIKEIGPAITGALPADDAAALQTGAERDDGTGSTTHKARARPATAHAASRTPASVQMRHPSLSAAPMPSALAVRQHAGELMMGSRSPASGLFSEAAQSRPRTSAGEHRPRTPAQTLSVHALHHERHMGQLANRRN